MKKKVNTSSTPVVIRLPKKMVDALDKAAEKNCRTRSSEVRSRLMGSLSLRVAA